MHLVVVVAVSSSDWWVHSRRSSYSFFFSLYNLHVASSYSTHSARRKVNYDDDGWQTDWYVRTYRQCSFLALFFIRKKKRKKRLPSHASNKVEEKAAKTRFPHCTLPHPPLFLCVCPICCSSWSIGTLKKETDKQLPEAIRIDFKVA